MPATELQPGAPKAASGWSCWWRSWGKSALLFLLIVLLLQETVFSLNWVPSASMEPTLLTGDRVGVNRLAYGLRCPYLNWWLVSWAPPARGEVVVFYAPGSGRLFVKRVLGIPGDVIECRDGYLLVNDVSVGTTAESFAPLTVPVGHYFVLGDNRSNSKDSRSFGCVSQQDIVGRVFGVVFSLESSSYWLPRPQRWWVTVR